MGKSGRDRTKRTVWRVFLTVAMGAGAFAALETLDATLRPEAPAAVSFSPTNAPAYAPAAADAAPGAADRRGNAYLAQSVERLNEWESLSLRVSKEGVAGGRETRLAGRYVQRGAETSVRFLMQLEGELAGEDARLLRVSDSRFLWTDLVWLERASDDDAADEEEARQIRRIDLRRLVREQADGTTPAASRGGGLPMLLASLAVEFDFAAPRLLRLDGKPILALIGAAVADGPVDHVLVALDQATMLPRLVEYRGPDDLLAAPGTTLEARLQASAEPLLRQRYSEPQSAADVPDTAFVYHRPRDLPWRDETQRELKMVREARAATPGVAPR